MEAGPHRVGRVTRACDRCHRNNNKCSPGPEPSACQTCFEFRSPCTYDRPIKRRGPKPPKKSLDADSSLSRSNGTSQLPLPPALQLADNPWSYSPLTDGDTISELVESYHTIVYPIFPLFHWPSFITRVRRLEYITDQAFFATVMAVCAIVVARQRHNAETQSLYHNSLSSEAFYQAAITAFPTNLWTAQGFEYKRAKVLMAIACIQHGSILEHQTHLGEYVVLAWNDGFQDETRWERGLDEIQRQERRRLFWSAYTLEVFSAVTWDGVVRFREQQTNVAYPAEVYDEDITEIGYTHREASDLSFLEGWNATTGMYRVLEHLVGRLKSRRREADAISAMFSIPEPSSAEIMDHLNSKYQALPQIYRSVQAMTGDRRRDCFGFQAANIAITFQTVKLALASAENHSVARSCEIAGELLIALAAIPTAYITAISAPMLHHLASCGHLLANIIQSPLSPWALMQVRNVLTAMIDLLSGLERSLSLTSDVSVKLRGHVAQIEAYMEQAARTSQEGQVFHSLLPQPTVALEPAQPIPTNLEIHDIMCTQQGLRATSLTSVPGGTLLGGDDLWSSNLTFEWPNDHQTELQTDLTANWPFDLGGGMYDIFGLGDLDGNVQGSDDI